jgi:hypothetical protein
MELLIFVKHGYTKTVDQLYPADATGNWLEQPGELQRQQDKINAKIMPSVDKAKALDNLQKKYDVRVCKNDVLEKYPDGWWQNVVMKNAKNKMQDSFGVVRVPDVAGFTPGPLMDGDVLVNKCRYAIPDGIVQLGKVVELPSVTITDKGA